MDYGLNWKSNTEIEEERKREEAEKAREDEKRAKKIEEIKASTDPSMDEMGVATIMVPLRR